MVIMPQNLHNDPAWKLACSHTYLHVLTAAVGVFAITMCAYAGWKGLLHISRPLHHPHLDAL